MRRVDKCPDGTSAIVTFKLAINAKKVLEDKNIRWNTTMMEVEVAPKNGISSFLSLMEDFLEGSAPIRLWYGNSEEKI